MTIIWFFFLKLEVQRGLQTIIREIPLSHEGNICSKQNAIPFRARLLLSIKGNKVLKDMLICMTRPFLHQSNAYILHGESQPERLSIWACKLLHRMWRIRRRIMGWQFGMQDIYMPTWQRTHDVYLTIHIQWLAIPPCMHTHWHTPSSPSDPSLVSLHAANADRHQMHLSRATSNACTGGTYRCTSIYIL